MPWARKIKKHWYVIDEKRKAYPAGKGKEGRRLAHDWAEELNRLRRAAKIGLFPTDSIPCRWTLAPSFCSG